MATAMPGATSAACATVPSWQSGRSARLDIGGAPISADGFSRPRNRYIETLKGSLRDERCNCTGLSPWMRQKATIDTVADSGYPSSSRVSWATAVAQSGAKSVAAPQPYSNFCGTNPILRKRVWGGSSAKTRMFIGARDRNRTGTPFLTRDFKSRVSTSFTTRAAGEILAHAECAGLSFGSLSRHQYHHYQHRQMRRRRQQPVGIRRQHID
jgi:hypothetical protein